MFGDVVKRYTSSYGAGGILRTEDAADAGLTIAYCVLACIRGIFFLFLVGMLNVIPHPSIRTGVRAGFFEQNRDGQVVPKSCGGAYAISLEIGGMIREGERNPKVFGPGEEAGEEMRARVVGGS